MGSHRGQTRRVGVRPQPTMDGPRDAAVARRTSVEEELSGPVDLFGRPDGFGTEASRSAQTFTVLDEYTVPDGQLALLREVSLSVEANGEAKVTVAGTTYGPYTGAIDITVPLDPGVLSPGHQIRVHHQSTDGISTTTRAQVVVLEV